jgi:predicted DNA binding CopG/RHH family protein
MNRKVVQRTTREGDRMNDVDEKKDRVLYLRMSDKTVKTIKRIAADTGMGLATWCRASLLMRVKKELNANEEEKRQ